MTLAQRTTIGIVWNFTEQLAKKGIGVVITLLLARFLVPADFGLVAMMAVFLAVATSLMDSGFGQALIRMQNAEQVDFNTAFCANLCLGLLAYIMLFAVAPGIAAFYEEPRLVDLIRVAGLGVLINAFKVVQVALLSRALNFKAQLQASIPAGIISGIVAVLMAYAGYGVWALVVQMLLAALVTTVLLWVFQGWRPSVSFSRESLSSMYKFGYKLFLSNILYTVFENVYIIVIAKHFSPTIAGYYFFSDRIRHLIASQLLGSIEAVTYPALATLQNDDTRLKTGYRKIVQVATFLLFPAMIFVAALAQPLFRLLLPNEWLPAVPYLQLICIASLALPLNVISINIIKVKGRSDIILGLAVFKRIVLIIILVISIQYGIFGVLIGKIIYSFLCYIPNSYFVFKMIKYTIREQAEDLMPGLLLAGVLGVTTYTVALLVTWPALFTLLFLGLSVGLLYAASAYVLQLEAFMYAKQILTERLRTNRRT